MRAHTVWIKSHARPWIVAAIAAGTIATLFLLFAPPVEAQSYGGEIRMDRRELRHDPWDRSDDWADVRRFQRQLRRLERSEWVGDRFEEGRARVELQRLIRLELVESHLDLATGWDRDDTGAGWNDATATRVRFAREQRVVRQLASIETSVNRGAPWALARERRLLHEFSRLTLEDALASGRELREDNRGLWNDLRHDRDEGRRDLGGDGAGGPHFRNDRPAPSPPPHYWNDDPNDREDPEDRPDHRSPPPDPDRDDEDLTGPPPQDAL